MIENSKLARQFASLVGHNVRVTFRSCQEQLVSGILSQFAFDPDQRCLTVETQRGSLVVVNWDDVSIIEEQA